MAHPNEDLVRRGYKAFGTGDIATLSELFADDIVWHAGGRSPITGDYKGKDEVFGFFAQLAERAGGTFRIDIHDVLANDEHVVALVMATGEREGKTLNSQRGAGLPRAGWQGHRDVVPPRRPVRQRRLLELTRTEPKRTWSRRLG